MIGIGFCCGYARSSDRQSATGQDARGRRRKMSPLVQDPPAGDTWTTPRLELLSEAVTSLGGFEVLNNEAGHVAVGEFHSNNFGILGNHS